MYYYTCPRFNEARTELLESLEFREKLDEYKDVFEEISKYVGKNLTTPEEIFYLDNLFQAEVSIMTESNTYIMMCDIASYFFLKTQYGSQ